MFTSCAELRMMLLIWSRAQAAACIDVVTIITCLSESHRPSWGVQTPDVPHMVLWLLGYDIAMVLPDVARETGKLELCLASTNLCIMSS